MSRLLGLGAEEVGLGRERSGRGGAGACTGWAAGAREETAAATAGPRERVKAEVEFWARREDWVALGWAREKGKGVMGRTGLGWVFLGLGLVSSSILFPNSNQTNTIRIQIQI
jgi:hypothetical protein